MDISTLKEVLEKNLPIHDFIIFKSEDDSFLLHQYLDKICSNNNQIISYVHDMPEYMESLFEVEDNSILQVYFCKESDILNDTLSLLHDTILVITSDMIIPESLNPYCIILPKLDKWQIEEYALNLLPSIPSNIVLNLVKLFDYNIFKITNEFDKLRIFPEENHKQILQFFSDQNVYEDISSYNIFNFISAIIKKDYKQLISIYEDINIIDIEPTGVVTLLYNNFKDIASIQLSRTATAESLNMPVKKFNAIKHNVGIYSKESIINILSFLSDIDKKLKTGILPINELRDYIIVKVLSS